jgi:acetyl esterase/lipase
LRIVQQAAPGLGHFYAPAGDGPFPAMLLLHGSEGALGWLGHREAMFFAAHGWIALPLAYSVGGNFWIGGDIWNVALDETERVMGALRAHPACDGRLGVYGWSRGAEHALLATALMAQAGSPHLPDALAAHAPPDRAGGPWRNLFYRHREAGEPIAPPPAWGFRSDRVVPDLAAWTWRGEPVPEGAAIPIEAYAGPVFLSVGDQDEIWPADMAARLAARMAAAGRAPQLHTYAGQPHMPDAAAWNTHFELLLDFFGRALGSGAR